jgi:spermidine dehydrogenase
VLRYLNPVMAAMGCGLGADVISAYSAFNFLMPGVNGYYRYRNGGADPTESIYIASFPGGNAGIARHFLKKIMPAALLGEYRMADILNSPIQWKELDKANEPVRMRLSSTVVATSHEGDPESAKGVVVTYNRSGKLYRVHAKAAILCGQQHVNRHICRDISPEYRQAMSAFHHAPMHVINVAVRNWKFLENIGIASARWFDGFGWWMSLRRNLEIPGQVTQPLDPSKPTVLTMCANSSPGCSATTASRRIATSPASSAIAGDTRTSWIHRGSCLARTGSRRRRRSCANALAASALVIRSSLGSKCGKPLLMKASVLRARRSR